jgi:pimeloyl-ACP methyl ester carboxylesterase
VTEPGDATSGTGGYVAVDGLALYYEIVGAGDPLVVIPGGLMTIGMLGPLLPALARSRRVIAIEPQAHGHTADVDRPLTYEQMAAMGNLSRAQLAVLPATTHFAILQHPDLPPIVDRFLGAPTPGAC